MSLVIGAKIYAENGTFLGDLVPDSYSFNSVCDDGGAYGSPQSVLSIKNSAGDYGNSTSHSSAFNPYALTPPEVRFGNEMLGKLTVSPYFIDAIDPHEVLRRLNCPK